MYIEFNKIYRYIFLLGFSFSAFLYEGLYAESTCLTIRNIGEATLRRLYHGYVPIYGDTSRSTRILESAGRRGEIEMVKLLIDSRLRNGRTALHYVAEMGYYKSLVYYLGEGVDVNAVDYEGKSALHYASMNGHYMVAYRLLKEGVLSKDKKDRGGKTALHYAARGGHLKLVELLVNNGLRGEEGDNNGLSPLHEAIIAGKIDVVDFLFKQKVRPARFIEENNPLHVAIKYNQEEIVRYLVEKEVSLNVRDLEGMTAILYVAMYGGMSTLLSLCDRGADINEIDNDGRNILHYLARRGKEGVDMARFILRQERFRYNVNSRDELKKSPLDLAIDSASVDMVELLVNTGAYKHSVQGILLVIMLYNDAKNDRYFTEADKEEKLRALLKIIMLLNKDQCTVCEHVYKGAFNDLLMMR